MTWLTLGFRSRVEFLGGDVVSGDCFDGSGRVARARESVVPMSTSVLIGPCTEPAAHERILHADLPPTGRPGRLTGGGELAKAASNSAGAPGRVHTGAVATVVAFHAHPDDEIILTGGTLAMLAAAGHRAVIVVACDGHVEPFEGAVTPRLQELRASAKILGVARVEHLGFADSGHGPILYPDPPNRMRFARAEVDKAAERLAAILREERPEALLSYDPNGGYGHRDHVRVHEVGSKAAELAGVARVLDATLPRELLQGLTAPARWLGYDGGAIRNGYTARADITHRIDVGSFAAQRMQALSEHQSVLEGRGRFARIGRALLHLPKPLRNQLFRWEWFSEEGARRPASGPLDDIFASPIAAARA